MRYLRYGLLIASAAACAAVVLGMKRHSYGLDLGEALLGFGLAAIPFLNFVYLLSNQPNGTGAAGRVSRLFSLWLSAKEADLQRRSGKEPS